ALETPSVRSNDRPEPDRDVLQRRRAPEPLRRRVGTSTRLDPGSLRRGAIIPTRDVGCSRAGQNSSPTAQIQVGLAGTVPGRTVMSHVRTTHKVAAVIGANRR